MISKEMVDDFINTSILHSKEYESASKGEQIKAVNQSLNTLSEHLEKETEDLGVQDVAEQAVFLFKVDKTLEKAELGVDSVNVDGISISLSDVDTTLAPSIKDRYGIVDTRKRRVGRYVTGGVPFRRGHPYPRL